MESQPSEAVPAVGAAEDVPALSVWQRAVAIFVRPGSAWSGLRSRAQWWFPMIILMAVNMAFSAGLWERAILPMQLAQMEERVASGQMPADAFDRAESMMRSPAGLAWAALPWIVLSPVLNLVMGLLIMLAVGFLLGGKLPFRQALEVATWSGLVQVPGILVTGILAWSRETMEGVHVSLGALLPEPEASNKLMRGMIGFLDGLGPFALWWIAVVVLGASALSGVPRKRVAWSIGGIYLGLLIFFVALGTMMRRGG